MIMMSCELQLTPLWREVVQVFARVPVRGPGRLVDDVGRDGADLDKTVVLDEDSVARQIAVDDGRLGPLKKKTRKENYVGF